MIPSNLRGARGTDARLLFDRGVEQWHIDCLDGKSYLHTLGIKYWSWLQREWLNASNSGHLNDRNILRTLEVAETIFKVAPFLVTQTLFLARPNDGANIADFLQFVGIVHRQYAGNNSYFGDAFGVAIFKGKRQAILCHRHMQDMSDEEQAPPIDQFVGLIEYIQHQRDRRLPEDGNDVFQLPKFLDGPADYRRRAVSLARYRIYLATVHHDIVRTLLKKHFFRSPLNDEEKEVLEHHYDLYIDSCDSLPARFERPVRFDTKNRYLLYKGDTGQAYEGCKCFCDRYPEATLAEHGIFIETRLLCQINSKVLEGRYVQSEVDSKLQELEMLVEKYSLEYIVYNLRLLYRKYDFLSD